MTSTTSDATVPLRGAGPLTTVFTTPDFCKSLYWSDSATPPFSSSVCMPPAFKQLYDYMAGMYSPGICPLGYTEGCAFPTSLAISTMGTPLLGGPLASGETARICCPSGYTCYTGTGYSYSKCQSTDQITTYWSFGSSTDVQTTAEALAYAIQVRWKESDLSNLETNPTVYGQTITATDAATGDATASANSASATQSASAEQSVSNGMATATSTASAGSSDSGSVISTGATIGIAVAVPIFSIALGALFFLIWRNRYKRKLAEVHDMDKKSDSGLDPDGQSDGPVELLSPVTPTGTFTTTNRTVRTNNELEATDVMELETMEKAQELPGPIAVAELPGDMPRGWEKSAELRS